MRRWGMRLGLLQALSGGGGALQALEWRGKEFMDVFVVCKLLSQKGKVWR